jgi:hypothetical protein
MRNSHDDANTLLHHETFEHDMNTTEGPVDSASAPYNSRPDTPVATTSISQKDDRMSIGFVINAAVETTKPIGAPVRHAALQPPRQNSNTTVVNTTLHGLYDSYTNSNPSHSPQNTSTQPVFYPQPANDYPKRRNPRKRRDRISSGPKYSEDQDFIIAYCHFVKDMDWDQIEHGFKRLLENRTKEGLTCRCSKIRRKWGLFKAGGDATDREGNKSKILHRTLRLPTEFLIDIGFTHWKDRLELCKAAGRSM